MKYKYVFVGLGASNLFGVMYALLHNKINPKDMLIIDKGKQVYSRDRKKDILFGTGGAGTFSDFKCIFSKDKSQEINTFLTDKQVNYYFAMIKDVFDRFTTDEEMHKVDITLPTDDISDISDAHLTDSKADWNSDLKMKQSECWHIGSELGPELIEKFENYIIGSGVQVMWETEVINILPNDNTVIVKDIAGTNKIQYNNLIIGVGRASKDFTKKLYYNLNVEHIADSYQMGVRFECQYNETIQDIVKQQYDFKYVKDYDNGDQVRTFCVCNLSAHVCVEDGNRVNGEGYGLKCDPKHINNLTNFGIIPTVHISDGGAEVLFNYIFDSLQGEIYYVAGPNYSGWSSMDTSKYKNISVYEYGNKIGISSIYVMDMIEVLNKKFNLNGDWIFWLPEYKEVGYKVDYFYNLSINDKQNIHMVGDTGVLNCRGIIPAAVTSMYVVDKIK